WNGSPPNSTKPCRLVICPVVPSTLAVIASGAGVGGGSGVTLRLVTPTGASAGPQFFQGKVAWAKSGVAGAKQAKKQNIDRQLGIHPSLSPFQYKDHETKPDRSRMIHAANSNHAR